QTGCRAPRPTSTDACRCRNSGVAACTNSTHLREKSLAALRNRCHPRTRITLALTFYFHFGSSGHGFPDRRSRALGDALSNHAHPPDPLQSAQAVTARTLGPGPAPP